MNNNDKKLKELLDKKDLKGYKNNLLDIIGNIRYKQGMVLNDYLNKIAYETFFNNSNK